LKIFHLF